MEIFRGMTAKVSCVSVCSFADLLDRRRTADGGKIHVYVNDDDDDPHEGAVKTGSAERALHNRTDFV